MARKRILYAFPTTWDARQLEACRGAWEGEYEVSFAEPSDDDTPDDLDPLEWLERAEQRYRGRIDGVTSSSDYPGCTLAAALAERLGLAGPRPEDAIRCSHKVYSRIAQRAAAPEAVPPFQAVRYDDPLSADLELEFPCFVKPAKGSFSRHARRIESRAELAAFLGRPKVRDFCEDYLRIFNRLVAGLTDLELDGRWFIAEGLLRGEQVTVEGYTVDGEVTILGVVDSVMRPGTQSFVRFDLPSRHPPELVERMRALARRVMRGMQLERSLFNLELIVDPESGALSILEVNPRIAGQFGDLYAKVHGTSAFEAQLALAAGETPRYQRGDGPFAVAASYPLRTFEPVRVARVPDAADLEAVRARWPDANVWLECDAGQELSDFDTAEDGASTRYAVVNLGAEDRAALEAKLAAVRARLDLRLEPLG